MRYLAPLILFVFNCVVAAEIADNSDANACNNVLNVKLQSKAPAVPFYLQLLESVGGFNDSLYAETAHALVKNEFELDIFEDLTNDERAYQLVHSHLGLDIVSRSIIDLKTLSKFYLPRIQAHYADFLQNIQQKLGGRLEKTCATDSFGTKIDRAENEKFAWLLTGDRIYCTPDDLFALQLSKKSDMSGELLPFDRIIGSSHKAPVLILFGDLHHIGFKEMFDNLYQSAESGKLRFVWRYVPFVKDSSELLPNYGAVLSLKNSDYSTLNAQESQSSDIDAGKSSLADAFVGIDIKNLGLRLTSHILSLKSPAIEKYDTLLSTLEDLPLHVTKINSFPVLSSIAENAAANEKLGISEGTSGLYINGAPVNRLEMDLFKLVNKIEEESMLIQDLMSLGFNLDQARTLLTKFALNRAVKLSEFHGGDNRYRVYENEFVPGSAVKKGGVAFINNIELDENYKTFSSSRIETYLGSAAQQRPGQLPALKENIHDLIFVLNLSDIEQLEVFFTFSKMILDKSIPQQIGILPLCDNEHDEKIAKLFYFLFDTTDSKEALAFLYQVFTRESDAELEQIYEKVPIEDYEFDSGTYQRTLTKYSISLPSVIINGVIHDMSSEWRAQMGRQMAKDVFTLLQGLLNGNLGPSMKAYLFRDAKQERNLRVIPKDAYEIKYKSISREFFSKSTFFKMDHGVVAKDDLEVWLVGDLNSESTMDQLTNIIEFMGLSSFDVQLRVIDTSQSGILNNLKSGMIDLKSHEKLIKDLNKIKLKGKKKNVAENVEIKQCLSSNGLPPHHSFMLVNSRYFRIDIPFTPKELEQIGEFEWSQRIGLVQEFMNKYPDIFNGLQFADFHSNTFGILFHDWKDLVITLLTKSFHVNDTLYVDDVARFDFGSMNQANSFVLDNEDGLESGPLIDLLVIIDPVLQSAKQLLSIVKSCIKLRFVRTRILLQPNAESTEIPPVKLFKGVYPSYPLEFDELGYLKCSSSTSFRNLPADDVFDLEIESPKRWNVASSFAANKFDPDNIKFAHYTNTTQEIVYELSNIVIEGFARDVISALPPVGLSLQVTQGDYSKSTIVLSNLGYFQLQVKFGTAVFSSGNSPSYQYALLSASTNPFDVDRDQKNEVMLNVDTLDGLVLRPRVAAQTGDVDKKLSISKSKQADINIFTVATGHLYERLTSIMMKSVQSHTKSSVKFWILSNYLSPNFKSLLPLLSEHYNFEYELITYKWPMWLRQQNQRQRIIWGYKILFLDVLFPVDLEQVIFVDADQINRFDMKELVDLDMGDCPYGFVPMCNSREEMEGYRFWKQGYWSEVLGDELQYHISALFKVNLTRFREMGAGDKLRAHYQKLSMDPNSLSNLDQDLPNNLQKQIPIYSLPQDFLWCETWCSDESFAQAKNIDLCNNPLRKEHKLDMAQRLVPEWRDYDQQVAALQSKVEIEVPTIMDKIFYSDEGVERAEDMESEIFYDDTDDDFIEHDEL